MVFAILLQVRTTWLKWSVLWHGSTKGWHCGTQTIVQRSSGDWSFVLCTQANFHPGRHSIPPDLGWCYSRVLFDSYQFHFHTKGMLCHYRYRPCKHCKLTAAVIPRGIVSQSLWSWFVSWFKTSSSNTTILKNVHQTDLYTVLFLSATLLIFKGCCAHTEFIPSSFHNCLHLV